ncbi:ergothioneine biosynthesis protein EgtB [Pelagibius litoralis]|uniref:Ergothioneine biosynthesis protein EgtB n=2 Tax=Pelagibius litoralis TaxID=374515 RepID=A0A967CCB3_9PROT|nr:ergothioneine biosynthesis protein EgtB [Pelagibius litoralis]
MADKAVAESPVTESAGLPAGGNDPDAAQRRRLHDAFVAVRARSLTLAAPLSPEDMVAQSMEDASPAKWHLAHTSWFFETFILQDHDPGYRVFREGYGYLFNSYYEAVGARHARPRRGLLTRPPVAEVMAYRRHVDQAMEKLVEAAPLEAWLQIAPLLELGLHHEMQHQELLLTDILHLLAQNPLHPAYRDSAPDEGQVAPPLVWCDYDGGVVEIGHDSKGFAFDCEGPRHETLLQPFALASRLVTNAEWLAFMEDGGYRKPGLWLSDGWARCQAEGWGAPLYWEPKDGGWTAMSLQGLRLIDPDAPVCHVSFYEAEAYARWAGLRLPLEAELELALGNATLTGNLLESDVLAPRVAPPVTTAQGGLARPSQLVGDVWEWSQSPYSPYPGFRAPEGAVGEYNGKFMCNQFVLRGGSCVTPQAQLRASYRNFFYPHQRWQFTGLRLAKDRQ